MRVTLAVGGCVMAAMCGNPPHHRAEERARAQRTEHPTQRRPSAERPVGEVAMETELDARRRRHRADPEDDEVRRRWTNSVEPQRHCCDKGECRTSDREHRERISAYHAGSPIR